MNNFSRAATLFALVGLAELTGCKKETPKVANAPETTQPTPAIKIEDVARDVLPANAGQELQQCFDRASRHNFAERSQSISTHGFCALDNNKKIPSLHAGFTATRNGREEIIVVERILNATFGSTNDKDSNYTWSVDASVQSDSGLKAGLEHRGYSSVSDYNNQFGFYTTDDVTNSKTSALQAVLPITKVMLDKSPKLEKYGR